jgi:hypothetical protein
MKSEPLLHPVALAAVALLVVNDHVLKARWPGFVTGKLSDVAGMIFFPLFLFVIVRAVRRDFGTRALVACAAATAVAFALVKTWTPAHDAFEIALGAARYPIGALRAWMSGEAPRLARAAIVMDATDLLAVPFVLVAFVVLPLRVRDDRIDDLRPRTRRELVPHLRNEK